MQQINKFIGNILVIMTCCGSWHTSIAAHANTANFLRTNHHFNSIKQDRNELYMFLKKMPKGGDLHNHLWGATYPENLVAYASEDSLCLDTKNFVVSAETPCSGMKFSDVEKQPDVYDDLINAWSMRGFHPARGSGDQHFFATFLKNSPIIKHHRGEILAELAQRASDQNLNYLELIITHGFDEANAFGKHVSWKNNLEDVFKQLPQQDVEELVKKISEQIELEESVKNKILGCGSDNPLPACNVKIRYQYPALRVIPKNLVFTHFAIAFKLAEENPKVVGINIVGPENNNTALRDFPQHMQMLDFFHKRYPQVHRSIHAGEFDRNLVTPERRQHHINDAITIGHAQRIGHGVDIAAEKDAESLLKHMAKNKILVEINLTSNDKILGITDERHPISLYLKYGVPIVLSTDDEGILRTNITREYHRATLSYDFDYATLKQFNRNSLSYSFLPGENLWRNTEQSIVNKHCGSTTLGSDNPKPACQKFLDSSEKASLQWQLERQLAKFEARKF